jgi:hypothetical protein
MYAFSEVSIYAHGIKIKFSRPNNIQSTIGIDLYPKKIYNHVILLIGGGL